MKMSLDAVELEELESLSDEELVSTIRAALASFRAARPAEDEPVRGDPSTAAHGGKSVSTLAAADAAAMRLKANRYATDGARARSMEKIIKGYNRL